MTSIMSMLLFAVQSSATVLTPLQCGSGSSTCTHIQFSDVIMFRARHDEVQAG